MKNKYKNPFESVSIRGDVLIGKKNNENDDDKYIISS